jgi:meso-butanediol dehydrogenase / (S,S)-butanediol dehydrogenase / diacetyl reductase
VSADVSAGRVALVTGAGGAIGTAVAAALAGDGFAVACTDLDLAAARSTAAGLDGARAFRCDVRSEPQVVRLRGQVERALGAPPWLLVNVAGVFFEHRITELAEKDWDLLVDVNLKGTFLTCKTFLPAMVAAHSGCIVNIASTAGTRGARARAAYCAAKGGVVLLTRSLALDHGPEGVRVNCVCPGVIDTPMADWIRLDRRRLRAWEQTVPARRIGTVDDVASTVSFLASPAAGYMHGAVVVVDGGADA